MATFRTYKLKDGSTRHQVYIRRRGAPTDSAVFPRRVDAERWARQREAEIREAQLFGRRDDRRRTLQEAIDRHQQKHDERYSPGWLRTRAAALDFWGRRLGQVRLYDLTPVMIDDARDVLTSSGSSPATVNRYTAILSSVLKACIREWQWLSQNPIQALPPKKEPRGREVFLTAAEVNELLALAAQKDAELVDWIALAVNTGGRRGELQDLVWREVNLRDGLIRFVDTKNGEDRSVPIAPTAREVLLRRNRDRGVTPIKGADPVLGPWPRDAWETVRAQSSHKDLHWHDLRHTFASLALAAGATLLQLGHLMGHKTPITTRRYAHLAQEHHAELVMAATASITLPHLEGTTPARRRRRRPA